MYQHETLSEPHILFSMEEMLVTLDRHNEVVNGYVMCKHSRIWQRNLRNYLGRELLRLGKYIYSLQYINIQQDSVNTYHFLFNLHYLSLFAAKLARHIQKEHHEVSKKDNKCGYCGSQAKNLNQHIFRVHLKNNKIESLSTAHYLIQHKEVRNNSV